MNLDGLTPELMRDIAREQARMLRADLESPEGQAMMREMGVDPAEMMANLSAEEARIETLPGITPSRTRSRPIRSYYVHHESECAFIDAPGQVHDGLTIEVCNVGPNGPNQIEFEAGCAQLKMHPPYYQLSEQ